jgi:hypothetical protein
MSTTTVGDLISRAEALAEALHHEPTPLPRRAWHRFDATTYRLLDLITDLPPAQPTSRPALLIRLRDAYPMPLTLLREPRTYTVAQYAAPYGYPLMTVRSRISRGLLPTTDDHGQARIDARPGPDAADLAPADPASVEPLDQLAATLGAVADLLAYEPRPSSPAPTQADRDALAARVLAITAVTARHALTRIPFADGNRPLLIGRYAEFALDALDPSRDRDSALNQIASFHPPTTPTTPVEHLEAALRGWADAARHELTRPIPSTAVLANIASQGIHLYAVADQITLAQADLGHLPTRQAALARREFRTTAAQLDQLGRQWNTVTTLQPPTHTYVTATERMSDTLFELTHHGIHQRASADLAARIDLNQAMVELRYGATDLRDFIQIAVPLPLRLASSELLFAPARALRHTPERLHAVKHGHYLAADSRDITALRVSARDAAHAARRGHAALSRAAAPDPPLGHGLSRGPVTPVATPEL